MTNDTRTKDPLVQEVIEAREAVRAAKSLKCTCTGFVIQYEGGCCCARGRAIHAAKVRLATAVEAL